ncbi:hypothetical protein V2J09_008210 [Rumex salicifolius]
MEGVSGSSTVPSTAALDKSRVLDVKPLRTLVPRFPNLPEAPPFVSSSPFGQFPAGFSPFYPFSVPQGIQSSAEDISMPTNAVPLRSFGNPQMGQDIQLTEVNGSAQKEVNGDVRGKKQAASRVPDTNSSQKKPKRNVDVSKVAKKPIKGDFPGLSLSKTEQENGSRELVNYVMMRFDAARRRISQLEDSKEAHSTLINRADLRAGNIMLSAGIRTNSNKRIGVVPGVEIGDIFFFRMEMCAVGLHAPPMAGIDYMTSKNGAEEEPVTLSIVSAGCYDDDADDKDVLIYTGHGGKDKVASDQKLERGNLALDKSSRRGNEIRVIRGIKDSAVRGSKTYIYDGLYTIEDSWIEKAKSGASAFKYKMVRIPGQPSAFSVWQSVQKWKQDITSRPGLILSDLTSGAESIPVSLVNDIDNEKGPFHFTYNSTLKYLRSFNLSQPSSSCHCSKECVPGDLNCGCIRKNCGDFPYTGNGVLVSHKPLVYECGPSCPCILNCKNRVLQGGVKSHLEVFKTKDKGWGLRSWDPLRAGAFICEFAGEVIDVAKFDSKTSKNNNYIFDATRTYDQSFKWNYDPELIEEGSASSGNEKHETYPLIISAKDTGNVGRFMNHSCSPNVFWQFVVTEENVYSGSNAVQPYVFAK